MCNNHKILASLFSTKSTNERKIHCSYQAIINNVFCLIEKPRNLILFELYEGQGETIYPNICQLPSKDILVLFICPSPNTTDIAKIELRTLI